MSAVSIKTYEGQKGRPKAPKLSVLIPYYRDDPTPLIQALAKQCQDRPDIEILAYDDGTRSAGLNGKVISAVKNSVAPIGLFIAEVNNGRSFARNLLTDMARGKWVLFLDADMLPEQDSFLSDYLEQIKAEQSDVIFGGFKVSSQSQDPDRELHRALSETSDCLTLEQRQIAGPQYVCSSNLAVRKDVLNVEAFDPEFSGWGWEDSEWAARVFARFNLVHADIPAWHLGLETTDTLLTRFQPSGPNYARFTRKHPELAKTLPLYRIVKKLRKIPGQRLTRPVLRQIVRLQIAPVRLRLLALKIWRASWYAETFA